MNSNCTVVLNLSTGEVCVLLDVKAYCRFGAEGRFIFRWNCLGGVGIRGQGTEFFTAVGQHSPLCTSTFHFTRGAECFFRTGVMACFFTVVSSWDWCSCWTVQQSSRLTLVELERIRIVFHGALLSLISVNSSLN